jgi:hypothetical protein
MRKGESDPRLCHENVLVWAEGAIHVETVPRPEGKLSERLQFVGSGNALT